MLPALHRLRQSEEFDWAVRGGVRAGRNCVVVHMTRAAGDYPARAGLVVSKAVGNSVVRSRVKRRIREALRPLMNELAPGTLLVVRALPASAVASWAQLQSQVSSGVHQCEEKWRTRSRVDVRPKGAQP